MIDLKYIRKHHPELENLPDEDMEKALDDLYGLANLALEAWIMDKNLEHKNKGTS